MATVNKDFRVKNGLVVEGTTATVNGNDILTTASTIASDAITEGSTNLFFTNARAIAAVGENLSLNDLSDVYDVDNAQDGYVLTFDGQTGWSAEPIPAVNSTDDVSEGSTNLYFTNARAVAAVEAANSLDLNTISVSGYADIETLEPGSGVVTVYGILQDSNNTAYAKVSDIPAAIASTDELTEGSTNLYFTDARAVSAVQDGLTFVDYKTSSSNDEVRTEAFQYPVSLGSTKNVFQFSSTDYSVAKVIVQARDTMGYYEASEVLVVHDDTNVYITEYANVTSADSIMNISAEISGGIVSVRVEIDGGNGDAGVNGYATLLKAPAFN